MHNLPAAKAHDRHADGDARADEEVRGREEREDGRGAALEEAEEGGGHGGDDLGELGEGEGDGGGGLWVLLEVGHGCRGRVADAVGFVEEAFDAANEAFGFLFLADGVEVGTVL